jgi:hypothetical protein
MGRLLHPPLPRPPSRRNSVIIPDFPKLFDNVKKKQFTLLWRGVRDGFGARDFDSRCDGHPNTVTVILDTDGNIFGGFTPIEWESSYGEYKSDEFPFHVEESAQLPGAEICVEGQKEEQGNLL